MQSVRDRDRSPPPPLGVWMTSHGQCPRGVLVNVFTPPLQEILYPRLDRDPPKSFTLFRPLTPTPCERRRGEVWSGGCLGSLPQKRFVCICCTHLYLFVFVARICAQTILFACKEILFAAKQILFACKACYFIAGKQKPLTTLNHGI